MNRSLLKEDMKTLGPQRTVRTLERDNRRAAGGKMQNKVGTLIKGGGFPRLNQYS